MCIVPSSSDIFLFVSRGGFLLSFSGVGADSTSDVPFSFIFADGVGFL